MPGAHGLLRGVMNSHSNSGGDRGAGSDWVYDGGPLVRKSILANTPVIVVTFKLV